MKLLFTLFLGLFFFSNLVAQEDKVKELVIQGTDLHDQGKYDEAIAKYKAALDIDKNSTIANYELSYTYMASGQYDNAIKYSKKVLEQNSNNQHEAYIVLGSSLDMTGKPEKAIKVYEEGLEKFPGSNLLSYNLALTSYDQNDYEKAEKAAIDAITIKPAHCSSHIILSAIMQSKNQRVKSMLPLYYSLMLEPDSKRSKLNYSSLMNQLGQGVERKDEKNITVSVPNLASDDNEFGPAEMMVSLQAASKFSEPNKSKMDLFVGTTKSFFSMLGELKKEHTGFWWDFYVKKFDNLVQSDNYEAFSYYISQSTGEVEVNKWIAEHPDKMQKFVVWMKN